MKWTWIWLVLLAVCLSIPIEKGTVPNQQLTLQLNADFEESNDSEKAISYIQSQLQKAGVKEIQIQELGKGKFRVAYYSPLHVSAIETLFELDSETSTTNSELPFEISKNQESVHLYQVDIVEIGATSQNTNGFAGVVVENQQTAERAYHPFVSFGILYQGFNAKTHFDSLDQNWFALNLFIKTRTNYEIPEVRAGPLA